MLSEKKDLERTSIGIICNGLVKCVKNCNNDFLTSLDNARFQEKVGDRFVWSSMQHATS